jgi:hypothetical protein
MHDDENVSSEVRETINETLRDTLSTDGWTKLYWDIVLENLHDDFDIKTDLFELAQKRALLSRNVSDRRSYWKGYHQRQHTSYHN